MHRISKFLKYDLNLSSLNNTIPDSYSNIPHRST